MFNVFLNYFPVVTKEIVSSFKPYHLPEIYLITPKTPSNHTAPPPVAATIPLHFKNYLYIFPACNIFMYCNIRAKSIVVVKLWLVV
jgi:hypothetical protein